MSWISVIWMMAAASCLTLAGLHILVWLYSREARSSLLFAIAAVAAAGMAFLELNLMGAQSPGEYSEILRWMHVSVATLVIAIAWFVYAFLSTGRRWLVWSITALRLIVLIPNFAFYPNASFAQIDSLRYVEFWGETFSAPVGEMNPWRWVVQLSMLLFLVFVLDAAVSAWKQGQHHRSLVFGGSVALASILTATFSSLMVGGVLPAPFVTLTFMIIVAAMAFELSVELLRARQLARELEISQRRMGLAAKAANLGLWEWDMAHDNVWVAVAHRERLGIDDSRQLSHRDYLQLVHPDDRDSIIEAINRAVEGGDEFEAEFRVVYPDGATRWNTASGQLERDSNGKPLRLRGVSMDITERKQAETDLQQHRRDLAHAARVSTLGQLSTALAHEINQPLGAILRNAEAAELFIQQTPPDLDEVRAILQDIRKDEQRAASVIERMRDLFKRRELRLETLAADELIAQIAKLMNAEIQLCHASLRIDIPTDLPRIVGDRVHLQQVVLNLVLNSLDALKAQHGGQREIVIQGSQTTNSMVELAVIDRGSGFAPEQLPHLFDPFYTTKPHGTGIGLAISKTIVDLHGGEIRAENNPDGGATVRFTVKRASEAKSGHE